MNLDFLLFLCFSILVKSTRKNNNFFKNVKSEYINKAGIPFMTKENNCIKSLRKVKLRIESIREM